MRPCLLVKGLHIFGSFYLFITINSGIFTGSVGCISDAQILDSRKYSKRRHYTSSFVSHLPLCSGNTSMFQIERKISLHLQRTMVLQRKPFWLGYEKQKLSKPGEDDDGIQIYEVLVVCYRKHFPHFLRETNTTAWLKCL